MAETDNLIREVDEEMRRERLLRLWDQFGIYIVGVAALIIFGIGGYRYIEYQRNQSAGAAGSRYQEALQLGEAGKVDEALKALQGIAKEGSPGFAALAQLRVAGIEAKKGQFDNAVTIYDRFANDPKSDPLLAGFAKLQAAMLRLGTADWTEMQNRLKDLAVDSSSYRASAREMLGIAAYKAGRTEEARRTFEQVITDKKAPQSVGDRARIMMLVLTEAEIAKSGGPAAKKAAAPGGKSDGAAGPKAPASDKPATPESSGKASATEKAPEPAKSSGEMKAEPVKAEPSKEADKAVSPAPKSPEPAKPEAETKK